MTLNFLDKAIAWLSPKWGAARAEYRSYYDIARQDRFGAGWNPPHNATPEMTDASSRSLVRARTRDLERNGDVTEGVIDAMVRNVVGMGFGLEAEVESSRGRPLDAINDRIEELWTDWAKAEHCDITGGSDFNEILDMVCRREEVDGEIFIVRTSGDWGVLPLKLQLVEPDFLAEDVFQHGENFVYGGVEVDKYMRAVAYHFRVEQNPFMRGATPVRVTADRVVHLFSKKRPTQTRGMPDMVVSAERSRNVQEYIASELESARTAAGHTGIVKKDLGSGAPSIGRQQTDSKGNIIEQLKTNAIHYLRPGEDIVFPQPGRPNVNAPGFVSMILRLIGMSRGLSYETVTRDLSQVNYSSMRGGQLEDQKTFRKKQRKLVRKFCDRVYEWFLEEAVLSGKLLLPGFFSDEKARKRYSKHKWTLPGWKWVDPVKEVSAIEKQLSLGLTTLSEVCGEQGRDWWEQLRRRKREIEACEELGMELSWFSGESSGEIPPDVAEDEPPAKGGKEE